MIAPLLPYAIRGVIWYQGESNVDRAEEYRELFPCLIRAWRQAWGLGGLAFHFVQLANFKARLEEPAESHWAELREAQALALMLPDTGMAVAIDIGETGDIHPKNKQDVGLRLALSALHQAYGFAEIIPSGPVLRSVVRKHSALRCSFDFTGPGLYSSGPELRGFSVAGADGRFVWAHARIEELEVVVSNPGVPAPVSVRYAWADNPDADLYNFAGLPASPFRADVSN